MATAVSNVDSRTTRVFQITAAAGDPVTLICSG